MKELYFMPMNDLHEQVNYYIVLNRNDLLEAKGTIIHIKDLKQFSEKFPNIILYKEYLEKEIDEEAMKYIEDNFTLKHLEKFV